MANTLDGGSFIEVWTKEMQREHFKSDVFRAIASFREQAGLKAGDKVNIPYRGSVYTEAYTRGSAVTPRNLTNAYDYLTVDVIRVVPYYIDDFDVIQSTYDDAAGYGKKAAVGLGNFLDGDVLGECINASSDLDDSDLGGTSGNGMVITEANIWKVFTLAQQELQLQNVKDEGDWFAVISPRFYAKLMLALVGRETALGDSTGMNGNRGHWFAFDLYLSNNTTFTADLQLASIPTANDTITINGKALTFVATLSANGQVHITDSAAEEVTNLHALLEAPTTDIAETGAGGYDAWLISEIAGVWDGLAATNNTTYLSITLEGHGWVSVSETLTAVADVWTNAKQIEHQLFGKKGAISVVIQDEPSVEARKVSDKKGSNYIPSEMYGLKTTTSGAKDLVDAKCTWA